MINQTVITSVVDVNATYSYRYPCDPTQLSESLEHQVNSLTRLLALEAFSSLVTLLKMELSVNKVV